MRVLFSVRSTSLISEPPFRFHALVCSHLSDDLYHIVVMKVKPESDHIGWLTFKRALIGVEEDHKSSSTSADSNQIINTSKLQRRNRTGKKYNNVLRS